MQHTPQDELVKALTFCAEMLEMLCPDTAGTPAAQNAREVLHNLSEINRTSGPVCKWGCNGDGQIFVSDGPDDGHLEPCECRIAEMTDPSYNNHPASWR